MFLHYEASVSLRETIWRFSLNRGGHLQRCYLIVVLPRTIAAANVSTLQLTLVWFRFLVLSISLKRKYLVTNWLVSVKRRQNSRFSVSTGICVIYLMKRKYHLLLFRCYREVHTFPDVCLSYLFVILVKNRKWIIHNLGDTKVMHICFATTYTRTYMYT